MSGEKYGETMAAQFEDADEEFLDAVDEADDTGLVEIDNELMEDIDEALTAEMDSGDAGDFESGDPGDESDEPEDQAEEDEQAQAPQQPVEEDRHQRQERQPQSPDFNRLAAKTRILERDNRIMSERLNGLLDRIQKGLPPLDPDAPAGEDDLPPLEVDAEAHITKRFERVERELKETKKREEAERAAREFTQEHRDAFQSAVRFRSQDPDQYDAAVAHLSDSLLQEAMERNPSRTQSEISKALSGRVQELFVTWKRNDMDPGEMVYNLARQRGFQWQPPAEGRAPVAAPPSSGVKVGKYGNGVADPRPARKPKETAEDVRRDRDRDRKSGSLSRVPGAPARGRNQERRLSEDEETYAKETRGVPLRELLKGHEVRGR